MHLWIAAFAALIAGAAAAEPFLTITGEGTISAEEGDDGVAIGDTYEFSLDLDLSAPDLLPDDPTWGAYGAPGTGLVVSVATRSGQSRNVFCDGVSVLIYNDHPEIRDRYLAIGERCIADFGLSIRELGLQFEDASATALRSDALPQVGPDPAQMPDNPSPLFVSGCLAPPVVITFCASEFRWRGGVDRVEPLPEPEGGVLAALLVLLVTAAARRRRDHGAPPFRVASEALGHLAAIVRTDCACDAVAGGGEMNCAS